MPRGTVNGSFANEYPETAGGAVNSRTDGQPSQAVAALGRVAGMSIHGTAVALVACSRGDPEQCHRFKEAQV
jgi:hypothetical protein